MWPKTGFVDLTGDMGKNLKKNLLGVFKFNELEPISVLAICNQTHLKGCVEKSPKCLLIDYWILHLNCLVFAYEKKENLTLHQMSLAALFHAPSFINSFCTIQ